jgi:(p)ppGpp synthase/HD superfamily hydrolase
MEEADRLAHRLCIIDQGKIAAEGTPANLKAQVGGDKIRLWFAADDTEACDKAAKELSNLEGIDLVGKCIAGITTEEGLEVLPPRKISPVSINVLGVGDLLTRLANCCHPLPGDKIIGYITQGRGITVHRKRLPLISSMRKRRNGWSKWTGGMWPKFTP